MQLTSSLNPMPLPLSLQLGNPRANSFNSERDIPNRRQLASYVGITPMPYQSGNIDRDRHIARAVTHAPGQR